MKKKSLIIIMAMFLWIIPIVSVINYSSLYVQAKEPEYELTVVDDESVPLSGGNRDTLNMYMIYAGVAATALATVYVIGSHRSRKLREEREELEASAYVGNLF